MHHGEIQQENPVIEKQREKVSLVVMAKKVSTKTTEKGAGEQQEEPCGCLNQIWSAHHGEIQQENPVREKQRKSVSLVVMAKKSLTTKTEKGQGNNKKSQVHLYMEIELFFARASRGDQQEVPA